MINLQDALDDIQEAKEVLHTEDPKSRESRAYERLNKAETKILASRRKIELSIRPEDE